MSELTPPSAERVWHERLARRLGTNPYAGVLLDREGVRAAHDLLRALADDATDEQTVERLADDLRQHERRVEDEHAARVGLSPRPR